MRLFITFVCLKRNNKDYSPLSVVSNVQTTDIKESDMKVECKGPQRTVISAFNQRFKPRSEKIQPKKRAIRSKKIGLGQTNNPSSFSLWPVT